MPQQNLLDGLLAELKSGGPGGYGLRRGAAYGISGIVKGLGIASLKGYGVLEALKAMVENKKDAEGREGSLQAFECLCEKLGRLFEPYVIHILPLLLQCFGDGSPQVGRLDGWWGVGCKLARCCVGQQEVELGTLASMRLQLPVF
jgi:hypothetical protein